MEWLNELPNWLRLVIALIPALLAVLYLGLPILIRFQPMELPEPQAFETFTPEQVADDVPEDVRAWFADVEAALAPQGFVAGDHLTHGDQRSAFSLLRVFRHPTEHTVATATRLVIRAMTVGDGAAEWRQRSQSLQLVTLFPNEGLVATTNTPLPFFDIASPQRTLTSLPQVQDPGRLLAVHRALVARRSDAPRPAPEDVGELGLSSMDEQVEGGLARRSADGTLRPTWKGAFLLTWSWLWPMSALRRARLRRRGDALIAELGV